MKFPYYSNELKKETKNSHFNFRHIDYLNIIPQKVVIEVDYVQQHNSHPFNNHSLATFHFAATGKITGFTLKTGQQEYITKYEYDPANNLIRINENEHIHVPDKKGNLKQIKWDNNQAIREFSYDKKGRIHTSSLLLDGETEEYTTYEYDDFDRITKIADYGLLDEEINNADEINLKSEVFLEYTVKDEQTICLYQYLDLEDNYLEKRRYIINPDASLSRLEYLNAKNEVRSAISYSYTFDGNGTILAILETNISYHDNPEGKVSATTKITYTYD